MADTLLLVGRFASPHVRRVAITLRLLGREFDHLPLSPLAGLEPIKPWNPVGRVPVLRTEEGERLVESGAIIDFLMETYGQQRALIDPSGTRRREALQLVAWANTALEKTTYAGYERIKRPEDKQHPPVRDALLEQAATALAQMESMIGTIPAPASDDDLTLDLLTAAVAYEFVGRFQPDVMGLRPLPVLRRLSEACEALPSFSSCLPER
ncbi:MAG: glutathione S-transferase family protein [Ectothiorhodospiraceae bacterium]|nr:glutathione S-transferase family protein [Ectothiorhodospiraceae bacterium]MCH8504889.1 glutathione S-transferase family protein [Ectothiorhodospiraceae bacterium]